MNCDHCGRRIMEMPAGYARGMGDVFCSPECHLATVAARLERVIGAMYVAFDALASGHRFLKWYREARKNDDPLTWQSADGAAEHFSQDLLKCWPAALGLRLGLPAQVAEAWYANQTSDRVDGN